jgi:hypothetical protein
MIIVGERRIRPAIYNFFLQEKILHPIKFNIKFSLIR